MTDIIELAELAEEACDDFIDTHHPEAAAAGMRGKVRQIFMAGALSGYLIHGVDVEQVMEIAGILRVLGEDDGVRRSFH